MVLHQLGTSVNLLFFFPIQTAHPPNDLPLWSHLHQVVGKSDAHCMDSKPKSSQCLDWGKVFLDLQVGQWIFKKELSEKFNNAVKAQSFSPDIALNYCFQQVQGRWECQIETVEIKNPMFHGLDLWLFKCAHWQLNKSHNLWNINLLVLGRYKKRCCSDYM